ncbi:MAG: T9SS type A sorting domain-containing protein, partial [Muribaculaceae bacterium]|nr:T9SS type A sorting domain-containing protein [Muribaculaceae bacterium]
ENPVLTIKFMPKEAGSWGGDVDGDGYQDYYITLHSVDVLGKDVYQWIILKGTAIGGPTQITNVERDAIFSITITGTELMVSGKTPKRIELLASNGGIVAECDNSSTLNIKHLSAGIYIAKIYTTDNQIVSHKILIK